MKITISQFLRRLCEADGHISIQQGQALFEDGDSCDVASGLSSLKPDAYQARSVGDETTGWFQIKESDYQFYKQRSDYETRELVATLLA